MTRILGISGSLRRESHNTSLLRAAAEAAGQDVELELYDGLKEIRPMTRTTTRSSVPPSVARLASSPTPTRCSSRRRSTTLRSRAS